MVERKPRVDWAFGPGHGPITGAVSAGLTALSATGLIYETGAIAPPWMLGIGAAVAAGSAVTVAASSRIRLTEGRAMCYRAACWLSAGAWSTWQLYQHPWSWSGVAALAGGTAVAAVVGKSLQHVEDKAVAKVEAEVAAKLAKDVHDRTAQVWQARLRKICRVPLLAVDAVEMWEAGNGYTLQALLPDDGTTIDRIKQHETELATAADLPFGCRVEVLSPGGEISRRVVHIRVTTANLMAGDIHYPQDYTDRTINNPITLGPASDGSDATIDLRYRCAVLVGQTDSGKSNELDAITAELARCTDVFICAIDLSGGGRYPREWVRPWYEGDAPDHPAIDWVANTPELAVLMTYALINVINGRTADYAELMHQQGADKIMPTPELPQIVLIVDEFKTLPDVVKANIETICDTGRGAGVRAVLCSLEAKAAAIPRSIIAQCRERIGMRVSDEAELQYLFDATWRHGRFDPQDLTHRGMGLVSSDAKTPVMHKGYRIEPVQKGEIAIACDAKRPALDEASIARADTVALRVRNDKGEWVQETATGVFHRRWEMALLVMFPDPAPPAPAAPTTRAARPTPTQSPEESVDDMQAAAGRMNAAVDNAKRAVEEADAEYARRKAEQGNGEEKPGDQPATGPDPEFDAIVSGFTELPARDRYRLILQQTGPTGATAITERLRSDGYPTARQTVHGWLAKDAADGLVTGSGDAWTWVGEQP